MAFLAPMTVRTVRLEIILWRAFLVHAAVAETN
jgi:hypothetical protein